MTGIPGVTHADPCTCAKCNAKANRIAAFGAIRRAAEVARELDEEAEYQADSGTNPMTAPVLRHQACEVRRAIRAAIGTEKA